MTEHSGHAVVHLYESQKTLLISDMYIFCVDCLCLTTLSAVKQYYLVMRHKGMSCDDLCGLQSKLCRMHSCSLYFTFL